MTQGKAEGSKPEGKAESKPEKSAAPAQPEAEPDTFPQSLDEFSRTHSPTRDRELMAGFVYYARRQGWSKAKADEWAARLEAFRHMEA